jgi:hypothetical protein
MIFCGVGTKYSLMPALKEKYWLRINILYFSLVLLFYVYKEIKF